MIVTPKVMNGTTLPFLLKVEEAADLLRTTKKAIYVKVERGQMPGVVRFGKRVLIRRDVLVDSLWQQGASSPQGVAR